MKIFNSVSDLQAASLTAGQLTSTKGYTTAGDGGGATYLIKTAVDYAGTPDEYGDHTLAGGTIAVLQDSFRLKPRCWGVKADNSSDDYAAWKALRDWYNTNRSVIVSGNPTPSYSVEKIEGVKGTSLLSQPLIMPAYFEADFSQTRFDRHPSWAEAVGTYLISAIDLYQGKFGGLSFDGVDYALDIYNNNIDEGAIFISGVQFIGGDNALRIEAQSSVVVFEKFKCVGVPHFLDLQRCDRLTLRDGWISQGALSTDRDATISVNGGRLIVENVLGVPTTHTGAEVAWINNNLGSVDVRGMRFGGEAGSCTAINNFNPADTAYPVFPSMVSIRDSELYSADTQGGAQTSCAVRLFALPNIVRFTSNQGLVDVQEVITWGSTANQAAELVQYNASPARYSLIFENNQDASLGDYPANLKPLFAPSSKIALTAAPSGIANESVTDTGIIPSIAGVYNVVFYGNPNAGGSSSYRSTWRGSIQVYTGFSGGIVKRVSAVSLAEGLGGGAFANAFTVTPVFWDGATENTQVATTDTTSEIRLKITGWVTGSEGSSFVGFIEQELPTV